MAYDETKAVLNQLVADLSQMSAVIHQTHWYMRGPEFLFLHPLMDDYQAEIDAQLDVISERLITLDGAPWSTLSEWAAHTGIESQPGKFGVPTPERFKALVAAYRYLADEYAKGIRIAGEEGDDSTQDIFTGFHTEIQKRLWMIQAQLDEAPHIAD